MRRLEAPLLWTGDGDRVLEARTVLIGDDGLSQIRFLVAHVRKTPKGGTQVVLYHGVLDGEGGQRIDLEGFLIGISALLRAMTLNEVMPSVFVGRELFFISAAVVGGISIFGGSGRIVGAVMGAALVYLLSIAMIYYGLQDYYQFALQGIIILGAVFITVTDFGKIQRRLVHERKQR